MDVVVLCCTVRTKIQKARTNWTNSTDKIQRENKKKNPGAGEIFCIGAGAHSASYKIDTDSLSRR
jgi:hypothetical protein